MSIREEIVKALRSRLVLRFTGDQILKENCMVCSRKLEISGPLAIYAPDEGYICDKCGNQFCPELIKARQTCVPDCPAPSSKSSDGSQNLDQQDRLELQKHLESLLSLTPKLVKGISRGIVEAPTSHIGLLYLLKDIPKPQRKDNESDKDYELRIKTCRINGVREKLEFEVCGRIERIRSLLNKVSPEEPHA